MKLRLRHIGLVLTLSGAGIPGCSRPEPPPPKDFKSLAADGVKFGEGPPEFVAAPFDAVTDQLAGAIKTAGRDNRTLVVFECDASPPCQEFRHFAGSGELDEALAGIRFLEYDVEEDARRLAAAGYSGMMLPRFSIPRQDGWFSGEKIEGSTEGKDGVHHTVQRLRSMLEKSRDSTAVRIIEPDEKPPAR